MFRQLSTVWRRWLRVGVQRLATMATVWGPPSGDDGYGLESSVW
jgi:hypothetical protein